MGFDQKKKGEISLAFVLMIVLLETNTCRAALIVKRNPSYQRNGRLDHYRIAEDLELELDLLVSSNFIRILADDGKPVDIYATLDSGHQAQKNCPSGSYEQCSAKGGGNPDCKSIYNRDCH
ncbi:hypothetical protein QQP08_023073 [Theobroma cacao]|uniref:Malectin/receptor protein kinase family protein, putative n=1 Tax=Theobroma cacao TaxID=3641 RepID=A0A061FJH2_THECC|nr:Malectin/receptor protein kinase family protein, putative [Theobroma cacao]WRX30586.1 hypothetical protein QQP08_023073 [Theobroma cacao]